MRTPDELRLSQIAEFFGVTVEFLRRDNTVNNPEQPVTPPPAAQPVPEAPAIPAAPAAPVAPAANQPSPPAPEAPYNEAPYVGPYGEYAMQLPPALREPEAPPYGLPSLRRDDNISSGSSIAELAIISARLMNMIGNATKGVVDGKFDIGKTIIVLRRLGDILDQKLREADPGNLYPPKPY